MNDIRNYNQSSLEDILKEITYSDQNLITKEITHAWNTGSRIDYMGRLWVHESSLPSILRMSYGNIRYTFANLKKGQFYQQDNCFYIRGDVIHSLINDNLQNTGLINRENYFYLSQIYRISAQESNFADEIQDEYYKSINELKRNLKLKRLNFIKHFKDELTNTVCLSDTQFIHIRSVSAYPELTFFIENILIVHPKTHKTIVQKKINDENELYNLCLKEGWNIDWYDNFTKFIKYIYYPKNK
ncbi:hypothetical protein SKM57_12320 [Acinetobacter faecalis]|uniref:hypothetical protein n=1 Tax=Acinetobacter faecalis TaxID=2665161 RepID=UPI002A90CDB8|nr:hypothetical protein [Acinetobacter faecalis]MDY6458152.1 hypothetical protein [Acinetobacter faecalis]MDY6469362.1 hypothetical protein [Acinetobacter faecalis]